MLSVICPIYNEEKYIAKCIESIVQQDYPKDKLEILFVDGMSTDHTREIIEQYTKEYPYIRIIDNPDKVVPHAMNRGIMASTGDVIIRLDAHAVYPTYYFSKLIKGLHQHQADNVGAQCRTLPVNQSTTSIAIAEALASSFGVGNAMFRIGITRDIETDTVPFGCFRRDVFEKVGLYDTELIRNQDDELNARIINHGGKIVLLAGLEFDYYARDSYAKLFKMYYQYGLYKPLVNKKLGSPATLRQFIPPVFVMGLVLGAILSICIPIIGLLYGAVILIYLAAGMILGIKMAKKHHSAVLALAMPFTFFVLHFSYGVGYIHGIIKILFKQSFHVNTNR
jgi:glycosyltransferase involved in cell wall biosynthesis